MLEHVERGRVFEHPTGKHALPTQRCIFARSLIHQNLDECASFRRLFPRRRAFASGELDDDIANPLGLTGLEQQILRQIVALVQHADGRNPIRHRRPDIRRNGLRFSGQLPSQFLGQFSFVLLGRLIRLLRTGREHPRSNDQRQKRSLRRRPEPPHPQASGAQAS